MDIKSLHTKYEYKIFGLVDVIVSSGDTFWEYSSIPKHRYSIQLFLKWQNTNPRLTRATALRYRSQMYF